MDTDREVGLSNGKTIPDRQKQARSPSTGGNRRKIKLSKLRSWYLSTFYTIKCNDMKLFDQDSAFSLNGLPSIFPRLSLGLIPIDISSWNKSLQAYGILTWYTDLFRQFLHTRECLKNPHPSQIKTVVSSLEKSSLSSRISLPPYPSRQSLYISPRRSPPSLDLPSVGWRVRIVTFPTERAWILSATICFSLW